MASLKTRQRELKGVHVLIMLIVFFGIMISVNGYFLFAAITSFSGEDVKGSYRQGLEYNQVIAARDNQKQLGWNVSANFVSLNSDELRLIVQAKDENRITLKDVQISGTIRHPTDLSKDLAITFQPEPTGLYTAQVPSFEGSRQFMGEARNNDGNFRFLFNIRP